MKISYRHLSSNGAIREALREKGQFWTPNWVAEAMVGYVIGGGARSIFDPAVGAGAFFLAAKRISGEIGRELSFSGTEIDPHALQQAHQAGLTNDDLKDVHITDFVLSPPKSLFKAIVANPPYIRHHRLSIKLKKEIRAFGASLIGTSLDGRAGLHVYFLLRALQLLDTRGRLAFIMPADTVEGVFSSTLWDWITKNYRLDAVVTFIPNATPFPEVDTNTLIFMIRNSKPRKQFLWVKCIKPQTEQLKAWTLSGFKRTKFSTLSIYKRQISEALSTGLSRSPSKESLKARYWETMLGYYEVLLRVLINSFYYPRTKSNTYEYRKNFLLQRLHARVT